MHIIILGGGAAGFFCAINCAEKIPGAHITLLEKTGKLLSKVKVSGGGRCNVTNALTDIPALTACYPRGSRELRNSFHRFSTSDTVLWFKEHGVTLKTEPDGRMFPVTDSSQTIIDCFMQLAERYGIEILLHQPVNTFRKEGEKWIVLTDTQRYEGDALVLATGGKPDPAIENALKALHHTCIPTVPSLFTFNLPGHPITTLMGLSVPQATVSIEQTTFKETGPLLITHWGLSGPVILRLSAWGARTLESMKYKFRFHIAWVPEMHAEEALAFLTKHKEQHSQRYAFNPLFDVPKRLWLYLLSVARVDPDKKWQEVSKAELQKLSRVLVRDEYEGSGKTTFKEEFVSSGGVNRKEIDFKTMKSRLVPGLYFAGEVTDVDGITGGFNFQNAWTGAYLAACDIAGEAGA